MLKVGVIGLGEQSCDNLIPAILSSEKALISCLCDIDKDALSLASSRFGIANIYEDMYEMFESEGMDVVVIASHPSVNYQASVQAIASKVHFFVEKPPAENLKEVKKLYSMSRENDVRSGVGMNFSFTEMSQVVNEVIGDVEFFGELTRIEVNHHSSKPRFPFWGYDNIVDSFLLAQFIHPLHLILSYGGSIRDYDFRSSVTDNPIFLDVILDFKSEITGILKCSSTYPYFKHKVDLYGSGDVLVSVEDLNRLDVITRKETRYFQSKPPNLTFKHSPLSSSLKNAGYENELDSFFDAVKNGSDFSADIHSMIQVYEIIDDLAVRLKKKYYKL